MPAYVEVYREGATEPFRKIPLADFVAVLLNARAEEKDPGRRALLDLVNYPEPGESDPRIVNLEPDWGFAIVRVYDRLGRLLYRHPHGLAELVGKPLIQQLLREFPEEKRWGFLLDDGHSLPPRIQWLGLQREPLARLPRLQIRRLPEEPPPLADFADFGLTPPDNLTAPVAVLLAPELHERLMKQPLSDEVEEGGFLVGRVFRHRGPGPEFLVLLDDVPKARHSGASLLHFTFTGDSFAAIRRELPEDRERGRLVGWYHTHLFPAREEMGLSTIDVDLHGSTFLQPWQLAGLINLEPERRVLRFYALRERRMQTCPTFLLPAAEANP